MMSNSIIAISVRQPWAELIMQNKKSVEVRKSITSYRGNLVIHAANIVVISEFIKANIDPKTISLFNRKALIGVVRLVKVIKLNERLWEELKDKHLIPGKWRSEDYKYAWILENPRRIKPIAYAGLPRFFQVNEESTKKIINEIDKLESIRP